MEQPGLGEGGVGLVPEQAARIKIRIDLRYDTIRWMRYDTVGSLGSLGS